MSEMVILKCQKCGANLQWDGTGNVMRCTNCEAEYMIHPRSEKFRRGREQDAYTGRGEVQGIPIVPGNDCSGLCPVESFAPKGWHICSRQASDEFYGDHASNPFVPETEYVSPDGSARILFRGSNIYTDRKLSRIPLFKQIDVLGSYMRIASPFTAEQYCDYLLQRDILDIISFFPILLWAILNRRPLHKNCKRLQLLITVALFKEHICRRIFIRMGLKML